MSFRWYVIQTHPNAEAAVERRLGRQQFVTHLPRRTTRAVYHGRVVEQRGPCFPSYLFTLLDCDGEAWKAVASTRGVLRLLPKSDAPVAVQTDEVVSLHEAELAGALVTGRVMPGERLIVWQGVLARRVVECLSVDDEHGLVKALFSCFGRQVSATLRLDEVTVLR